MYAETNLPVVLAADEPREGVGVRRENLRVPDHRYATWQCSGVELHVRNVETHVEVFRHVPLSTRTDPPLVPVVVAASAGNREHAHTSSRTVRGAEHGICLRVVACRGVAAVERRSPLRAPEVLVAGVDAPSGCQLDAGGVTREDIPAVNAIRHDAERRGLVVLQVHIAGARVLIQVPESALR